MASIDLKLAEELAFFASGSGSEPEAARKDPLEAPAPAPALAQNRGGRAALGQAWAVPGPTLNTLGILEFLPQLLGPAPEGDMLRSIAHDAGVPAGNRHGFAGPRRDLRLEDWPAEALALLDLCHDGLVLLHLLRLPAAHQRIVGSQFRRRHRRHGMSATASPRPQPTPW